MKSVATAIAAVAAAAAAVSAQTTGILSVTSPIEGTQYTAGRDALITWTNPTVETISQIVLAHGDPTNLQSLAIIATGVDASAGSYTWPIPANTTAGTDYALVFGTSPDLGYSPRFTIQGASGNEPSSSSSSAAASSTSAAASSSSAPAASSSAVVSSAASSSALPSSPPSASSASSSASSSAANAGETPHDNAGASPQPVAAIALALGLASAVALLV